MTLRQHFNADKLRQALLQWENPESVRHCTATARLVSAYYLGLPLFELEDDASTYPTLFDWVQLAEKDIPGKPVQRVVAVQEIPEEFSPRLPVALFLHLSRELEAILYTDHFCDRRSALILRLLVDDSLGLSLTDEYVADFLITTVERHGSSGGDTFLCEQLLPAVLELDVVLTRSYMISLEMHLLDQIDLLFASLPLKTTTIGQLPRPPIYLPSPSPVASDKEASTLFKIHSCIRMTLTSLHITNRLQSDLRRTTIIFSEPDAEYSGGKTVISKLTVVVLSLIYRDSFSLAEHAKYNNLPEVAMRYKALIGCDEEMEAIRRWHSLSDERDTGHVNLFFEYIKGNFQPVNSLPPLDSSTRDVWYEHLCRRASDPHTGRDATDWVSGLLLVTRKVTAEVGEQMEYIARRWKGLSDPEPSLIPLKLNVTPDILCKSLPAPKKRPQSAREALESARESKIFLPRSQILEEYTLKAKEQLARKKMKEKRRAQTQREPRYMRSTLGRDNLHMIAESQSELRKSVEAERLFLRSKSSATSHSLSSLSSSSSSLSSTSTYLREDAIRRDIKKLDNKIEVIGKLIVEKKKQREPEPLPSERPASEASILPFPDNYKEVPAAVEMPVVEKLDFTMLSPSPRPQPMRLLSPEEEIEEEIGGSSEEDDAHSQMSMLSMSTAQSFKEMPSSPSKVLLPSQPERLPLLHYTRSEGSVVSSPVAAKTLPQMATTERSVQTTKMTLGEMKPMSRQDISAFIRSRQT